MTFLKTPKIALTLAALAVTLSACDTPQGNASYNSSDNRTASISGGSSGSTGGGGGGGSAPTPAPGGGGGMTTVDGPDLGIDRGGIDLGDMRPTLPETGPTIPDFDPPRPVPRF